MRKRSRNVSLAILGATAFGLAGCKSQETDANAFPDEASCIAAAQENNLYFNEDDCRTAFAEAQQNHAETAPRYESLELCEEEHGEGNCGSDQAQQGGGTGSIFMPLMMGYLIGSMMGGNRGVMSQPLVRTGDGRFATPAGDTRLSSNSGTGKMATNAFTKAPTTMGQPPMTRAQVSQRGGFGKTAAGRSGGSIGG